MMLLPTFAALCPAAAQHTSCKPGTQLASKESFQTEIELLLIYLIFVLKRCLGKVHHFPFQLEA